MCFSSGNKKIFTVFAGRKYSEHFDLIFSCLLWTVRIIYLNLLLLLLFYLRETLSFQEVLGCRLFFLLTFNYQLKCLKPSVLNNEGALATAITA